MASRIELRGRLGFWLASVALLLGAAMAPLSADARTRVGISLGFPLAFGPPAYFGPPPAYYYPPPPVVYAPPPVVYAPPPAYAPPAYAPPPAPVASNPQQTCREYQSTVVIAGKPQQTHGTACLQPDGSWRIVQ